MGIFLRRFKPARFATALLLGTALSFSTVALPLGAAATATTAAAPVVSEDAAAIAWSVSTVDSPNGTGRPNFSYESELGSTVNDAIRITNTGSLALDLSVYPADAFTTSTGQIDLDTADVAPDNAGAWIQVEKSTLTLQPGQQADVPFTLTVPADARPGDHSGGIITSLSTGGNGALSIDRRLATRVNVRVPGELVPSIELSELGASYMGSWNPFALGSISFDYTLTNTGNTRLTGVEAVAAAGLFGLANAGTAQTELPEVLPGSTIEVHRELATAPWGLISGTVVVAPEAVGFGAQGLDPVKLDYRVAAVPWTLVVVLLIAAAVTAVLLLRRRRKLPAEE